MRKREFSKYLQELLKRLLYTVLFCFLAAIFLLLTIFYGFQKHPELVFFALLSFAISLLIVMAVALFYGLSQSLYLRRSYPGLWKRGSQGATPIHDRMNSILKLHNTRDSHIKRASRSSLTYGIICLVTWFLILVVVGFGAYVFKNDFFINLLENFK